MPCTVSRVRAPGRLRTSTSVSRISKTRAAEAEAWVAMAMMKPNWPMGKKM